MRLLCSRRLFRPFVLIATLAHFCGCDNTFPVATRATSLTKDTLPSGPTQRDLVRNPKNEHGIYRLNGRFASVGNELEVVFENVLAEDSVLTDVIPSCNCLAIDSPDESFQPNERKALIIHIDSRKLVRRGEGSVELIPMFNGKHYGFPIRLDYTEKRQPISCSPRALHVLGARRSVLSVLADEAIDRLSVSHANNNSELEADVHQTSKSTWDVGVRILDVSKTGNPATLLLTAEDDETNESATTSVDIYYHTE